MTNNNESIQEAQRLVQRIVAIRENAEGDGWRLNTQAIADLAAIEDFLNQYVERANPFRRPPVECGVCHEPADRLSTFGEDYWKHPDGTVHEVYFAEPGGSWRLSPGRYLDTGDSSLSSELEDDESAWKEIR